MEHLSLTQYGVKVVGNTPSSLTTQYLLNNTSDPVSLTIVFGPPGVATMTKVKLDDQILLNGVTGSIVDVTIGYNDQLDGRFLTIYMVLTATSAVQTPTDLIADLRLTGGQTQLTYTFSHQVTSSGASVIYLADIYLTQAS